MRTRACIKFIRFSLNHQDMGQRYITVDSSDNVSTAITDLMRGEEVEGGAFNLLQDIEYGHKFALQDIDEGEYVVKYGERIGRATTNIRAGEHVHVHNVEDIVDEVRKL